MSRVNRSWTRGSANAASFISVTNQPGAMALTCTLWRAHSTASVRVSEMTAPLVAEYIVYPGSATAARTEDRLMTLPACWRIR